MLHATRISASGHDLTRPTPAQLAELAASLSPEERRVLLNHGTEPAFCGGLLKEKSAGVYHCRLCSLPLFRSVAKFESGTGWLGSAGTGTGAAATGGVAGTAGGPAGFQLASSARAEATNPRAEINSITRTRFIRRPPNRPTNHG